MAAGSKKAGLPLLFSTQASNTSDKWASARVGNKRKTAFISQDCKG